MILRNGPWFIRRNAKPWFGHAAEPNLSRDAELRVLGWKPPKPPGRWRRWFAWLRRHRT